MPTTFRLVDSAKEGVRVVFTDKREEVEKFAKVNDEFFENTNAILVNKEGKNYIVVYVKNNEWWEAAFKAGKLIRNSNFEKYVVDLNAFDEETQYKIIVGILSTAYIFDQLKNKKVNKEIKFVGKENEKVREALVLMEAQYLARDLANLPANELNPETYEQKIKEIFKDLPVNVKVIKGEELAKEGLMLHYTVGKGSDIPPRLVILEYNLDKGQPIALVGKGITFDAGGYDLKPSWPIDYIYWMHGDMSGSAAVVGAIYALAKLKVEKPVVGLLPLAENLISGRAYKPGDVIKAYNGKTVEIKNTDAEGRLVMADALAYSAKYNPKVAITIATLTGGQIVAVGTDMAAVMGDKELVEKFKEAGEKVYELVWELPLWEKYKELLRSDVADIANSGGKEAQAIQGGLFLKEFAPVEKFLHIDIAGPAIPEKEKEWAPKGMTGFGVRLLFEFVKNF